MNVGTQGAIKGGVSAHDLKEIGCQIELSNTYHLHLRPGDDVVRQLGGLHKFMDWDGPILTDSGGFQVFSLAGLRKIKEEGVYFSSHIDGHKIFMGPEESMQIQSHLGSDIAMAFDECVENPATYDYAKASCERTARWLVRCKEEHDKLNNLPQTVNPEQMLFGINQGATFPDLRIWHMEEIKKVDCEGYAIGGLAVGEPTGVMYDIIDAVEPHMPQDKPRYLMGVGTPSNIIEAVARGVDFFDCVMPARNARHGRLYTWEGAMTRRLMTPVIVLPVSIFHEHISAICSWRERCWPCGWPCSITSISITHSWNASATLWIPEPSLNSGQNTVKSWTVRFNFSESLANCLNIVYTTFYRSH